GVVHLLAHGHRHPLNDALGHVGGARNLLGDAAHTPHLAGAGLGRRLAGHPALAMDAAHLAGAGIALVHANVLPDMPRPAGLAIRLLDPFTAAARHGFAGRHRLADLLDALAVAGLGDLLAALDADLLGHALGH